MINYAHEQCHTRYIHNIGNTVFINFKYTKSKFKFKVADFYNQQENWVWLINQGGYRDTCTM